MPTAEHQSEGDDSVTLSNGKRVRIRALRRDEDGPIRELWPHLSPRTRYLRFLSIMSTLPDSLVRRLVSADDCRTMAFVAEYESDDNARIVVGLANLGAVDDISVEVGLVVRDDWQRQHVGTQLAAQMMRAAERRGFHRFVGHVLDENVGMRKLLKKVGEIVSTRVSGSVHELAFIRRRAPASDLIPSL
jgi:RimJ/RimL family protein N-acetyltransferase